MTANGEDAQHRHAVIGSKNNFWLYDSRTGFDLTHPTTPSSPAVTPRVTIETATAPITVDPAKSALVIIDMQNYFLSEALGRGKGAGHKACDELVQYAVPAARKAGIRIIWVNWGLSQQEVDDMPPSMIRAFGFVGRVGDEDVPLDKYGEARFKGGDQLFEDGQKAKFKGLGSEMGIVKDPASGKEFDAGKMLMRDQWNTALYSPLDKMYQEGKNLKTRPDMWAHKNRMSGMWGPSTACEDLLQNEGIKTLFFAGVNTDQCVGGTYQDCVSKGYDCVLLGDGSGTTSPDFAQQCLQFNAQNTWGFLTSCEALAKGVNKMES